MGSAFSNTGIMLQLLSYSLKKKWFWGGEYYKSYILFV